MWQVNNFDDIRTFIKYGLKGNDVRKPVYQLKTIFHELFHANAEGISWDGAYNKAVWSKFDDTFAECTAHYLTKAVGQIHEIFPSYANHLIELLPKLKRLPEFQDCKTIIDFGEKVLKYRYSKTGKNACWRALAAKCDSIEIDMYEYAKNYIDYVLEHKEEIVDKFIENAPKDAIFRNEMLVDITGAWKKLRYNKNAVFNQNEILFLDNGLIFAMNRKGVL
jgi:hypothetical protein